MENLIGAALLLAPVVPRRPLLVEVPGAVVGSQAALTAWAGWRLSVQLRVDQALTTIRYPLSWILTSSPTAAGMRIPLGIRCCCISATICSAVWLSGFRSLLAAAAPACP